MKEQGGRICVSLFYFSRKTDRIKLISGFKGTAMSTVLSTGANRSPADLATIALVSDNKGQVSSFF